MLHPKPNFFIAGAPKCGTTSLAEWLATHPRVCVSRPKELHYFDPGLYPEITTLEEYEACFAHALPTDVAIGEASPYTMFSNRTIENVLSYQPDAKFIICLRNPIEMAVSFHNQIVFNSHHATFDFLKAWNSATEFWMPLRKSYLKTSEHYRFVTSIGTHLKNISEQLAKERLLTVVMDDIVEDQVREIERITGFLGVDVPPTAYPRSNTAKKPRSVYLKRALNTMYLAKRRVGIRRSLGIGRVLQKANISASGGVARLTPEIHALLAEHFRPEIALLETLLERDLSHWLAPSERPGPE